MAGVDKLEKRRRFLAGIGRQGSSGQDRASPGIAWRAARLLHAHLLALFLAVRLVAIGAGLRALNLRGSTRACCSASPGTFRSGWSSNSSAPSSALRHPRLSGTGASDRLGNDTCARGGRAPLKTWQKWLYYLTAFGLVVVTLGLAGLAIAAPIYARRPDFAMGHNRGGFRSAGAGSLPSRRQFTLSTQRIALAAASAGVAYALMFAVRAAVTDVGLAEPAHRRRRRGAPALSPTSMLASVRFHEPEPCLPDRYRTLLTGTDGAVRHLLDDPACAMALIPAQNDAAFRAALQSKEKRCNRLHKSTASTIHRVTDRADPVPDSFVVFADQRQELQEMSIASGPKAAVKSRL